MGLECTVCLNSLLQAAPAPDVDVAIINVQNCPGPSSGRQSTARMSTSGPRKTKAKAMPKFADSNSLTDTCVTPCGHIFHAKCLKQWFSEGTQTKASCPNCRKAIGKSNIVMVYLDSSDDDDSLTRFTDTKIKKCDVSGPAAYNGNSIEELKQIHNLLITDYNELMGKFNEKNEENDIHLAQYLSIREELETLKASVEESNKNNTDQQPQQPTPRKRALSLRRVANVKKPRN